MKNRIKHSLYLTPAVLLLVVWIVAGPSFLAKNSTWTFLAAALVIATVVAWCVTLFVHAVLRDRP